MLHCFDPSRFSSSERRLVFQGGGFDFMPEVLGKGVVEEVVKKAGAVEQGSIDLTPQKLKLLAANAEMLKRRTKEVKLTHDQLQHLKEQLNFERKKHTGSIEQKDDEAIEQLATDLTVPESAAGEAGGVAGENKEQEKGFRDDPIAWVQRKFGEISESISGTFQSLKAGAKEKLSWKSVSSGIGKTFATIKAALEEMRDGIASFIGTSLEDMRGVPILGGIVKSIESFIGADRGKFFAMLATASISLPLGLASFARQSLDKGLRTFGATKGWNVDSAYTRFIELLGKVTKPTEGQVKSVLQRIGDEMRKPFSSLGVTPSVAAPTAAPVQPIQPTATPTPPQSTPVVQPPAQQKTVEAPPSSSLKQFGLNADWKVDIEHLIPSGSFAFGPSEGVSRKYMIDTNEKILTVMIGGKPVKYTMEIKPSTTQIFLKPKVEAGGAFSTESEIIFQDPVSGQKLPPFTLRKIENSPVLGKQLNGVKVNIYHH